MCTPANACGRFRFRSAASAPVASGWPGSGRLIDWEIFNRPNKGQHQRLQPLRREGGARRPRARRSGSERRLDHRSHRRVARRRAQRGSVRFRSAARAHGGRSAHGRRHVHRRVPDGAIGVREPELPRRRGDGSIQSLHTAQRGRLQHPRGPVRDPRAQHRAGRDPLHGCHVLEQPCRTRHPSLSKKP